MADPTTARGSMALVVNAKARLGGQAEAVRERLAGVDAVHMVDDARRLPEIFEAVTAHRRVVVAGGDGTVACAADVLAHSDAEMAVVPLGTQNNFARSLRIPSDVEQACDLALRGTARPTDLGCAEGAHFANALTIGISGHIARATPPDWKRVLGQVSYGLTAVRLLATTQPFEAHLTWPDGERTVTTYQIVVANGARIGDAVTAPDGEVDDGLLDIRTIGDDTRGGLLAAWKDAQPPEASMHDNSFHMQAAEVRIETDPPQRLDLDGELGAYTPARVWAARDALQVVRPG